MGEIYDMIKNAQGQRDGERKMWESVVLIDEMMEDVKEVHPELYDKMRSKQHFILFGYHFDEYTAKEAVRNMYHADSRGNRIEGEHWTAEQANDAVRNMRISADYNKWDIYYSLNATWHDLEQLYQTLGMSSIEEKIIRTAVCLYLKDEDAPDGKPYRYYKAMMQD